MSLIRHSALLLLLVFLAACVPTPAVETGRLYVLHRSETGWDLAKVNETGSLEILLTRVDAFAPGARNFAIVMDAMRTLALWDGRGLNVVYRCKDPCDDVSWSPDGSTLTWVDGDHRGGVVRAMHSTRATPIVLGTTVGKLAWAAGQSKLAFPVDGGLAVWSEGETLTEVLPFVVQGRPTWAPDGSRLAAVLPSGKAVFYTPGALFPQPLTLDVEADVVEELVWSPDGAWIAVLRRQFFPPADAHNPDDPHDERPGAATLGAQPWLYNVSDGSLIPLPGDPSAAFAHLVWSPDGRRLAMTRMPMGTPQPRPEVWVIEAASGERILRIPDAAAPAWAGPSPDE